MARPIKPGLDYFPLDVDISGDEKMEIIEADFGPTGFFVILKLFMRIYGVDGYYMMFTSREQKLFAKRINVDINLVIAIINSALDENLFDKRLYEKYGILTSKGIQTRYLEAVERRTKIELIKEFLLVKVPENKNIIINSLENDTKIINVCNNSINVCNNSINDDIACTKNTQSKVKESKVNNKLNKTKLNLLFNLIINNKSEDLEQEMQYLQIQLKHFDILFTAETINYLPANDIDKYKILYYVINEIYQSSYKVYLNKLTKEKIFNKYLKTEKYIGVIDIEDDEKLSEFVSYLIKSLQDEFENLHN